MRDIFYDTEDYPRFVGKTRDGVQIPAYFPVGNQTAYEPIGSIPQVNHTFKYIEATYGIMNEHQVGISETTCSGVSIDSLSLVSLERCTTSRRCVWHQLYQAWWQGPAVNRLALSNFP